MHIVIIHVAVMFLLLKSLLLSDFRYFQYFFFHFSIDTFKASPDSFLIEMHHKLS